MEIKELKRCTGCKRAKPITEYYLKGSGRKGRFSKCKKCAAEISHRYRHTPEGREVVRICGANRRRRVKGAAFDRLGRVCKFCGDDNFHALTIDHIHKDGAKERGDRVVSGYANKYYYNLYRRLAKDPGVHSRYQVLCMKCNWLRRYESDEEIIARYGNKKA